MVLVILVFSPFEMDASRNFCKIPFSVLEKIAAFISLSSVSHA